MHEWFPQKAATASSFDAAAPPSRCVDGTDGGCVVPAASSGIWLQLNLPHAAPLHAYRLRNTRLHEAFNARLAGGTPTAADSPNAPRSCANAGHGAKGGGGGGSGAAAAAVGPTTGGATTGGAARGPAATATGAVGKERTRPGRRGMIGLCRASANPIHQDRGRGRAATTGRRRGTRSRGNRSPRRPRKMREGRGR